MIKLSNTRVEIRKAAEDAGFVLAENRAYTDIFYREVKAPATRMAKMAAEFEWHLAEQVTVDYSEKGVAAVRLYTPSDQALLTGKYVSVTARKEWRDSKKREAALDYLRKTSEFYAPLV
ncbi:hypothetical protein KHO57_gp057 [Mycobacterium phage Phabba]|uniref:Uncharacterized protein n=1 Tax=Mycobacterium phage Phabba TaxID=2027899 RepID=A0A249XSA4_9CAUD|nr:hypothetical protein KHO57_gp057 [Mycobacterium phage Phabba]ASZ74632.1 hypothetical protein SEA_PHABBA_57 [Mycobacterium phage Phabba]